MKQAISIAGTMALMAPLFLLAAGPTSSFGDIGSSINAFIDFVSAVLIPAVFALALLLFLWGMFKFFFLSGSNDEGREEGKNLMLWGVIAFVAMVCIWGLVNLVASSLNLTNTAPTLPVIQ